MREYGPPTEDDINRCRLKHFLNFDHILREVMTQEELYSLSDEEKCQKVCKMDVGGYWVNLMSNNGLWHVVLYARYTLILSSFEKVCDMLQKVPPDLQVKHLDDRPETYYLVGPIPAINLTLVEVPDYIPPPLPDQPFAMRKEHISDASLKWDFAPETKKSLPLGKESLLEGSYIFSSRFKRWRYDFIYRSNPVKPYYLMLKCDADRRPYHLEFAYPDEEFIDGDDDHNLAIIYCSDWFQGKLNELKEKIGIFPRQRQ